MNIIDRFRKRAFWLRIGGYSILAVIIILLGIGGTIFFKAGDITRSDVSGKITTIEGIEDQEKSLEAKIKTLEGKKPLDLLEYEAILNKNKKDERKLSIETHKMISDVLDPIEKKIRKYELSEIKGFVRISDILEIPIPEILFKREGHSISPPSLTLHSKNYIEGIKLVKKAPNLKEKILEKVEKMAELALTEKNLNKDNLHIKERYEASSDYKDIGKLNDELYDLEKGREIVKENRLNQKFGNTVNTSINSLNISNAFLIQTNITRFGALLLILFFVGILVNLYRYNVRLAGYYDARADSLEMLEMDFDKDGFAKLVTSVSPEQYDFGKNPNSSTDQALDIVHKVSNKFKSS